METGWGWGALQEEAGWDQPGVPGTINTIPLVALRARGFHRKDSPGQALGPVPSEALLHRPSTFYHSSCRSPGTLGHLPGH